MLHTRKVLFYLGLLGGILSSCHTVKWNSLNTEGMEEPPASITAIFDSYPDQILVIETNSPGFTYKYDIGEKDVDYGDSAHFSFKSVHMKLHERTPSGKLLSDITFIDASANEVVIEAVDLLRLIPKFDAIGDMIYPEMIEEEYNRFGYTFRKEHDEFEIKLSDPEDEKMIAISDRAYRCQVVNNCLSPTKWEFALTTEDYSDFKHRLKDNANLNQNKILSHSWFFLDEDLYAALVSLKNPGLELDLSMQYDTLSNLAENVRIDFELLRNPIKYRANAPVVELGYKSGRVIEPLDNEQYYKREFELFMEGSNETYTSILETPVKTTQFKDAGFYTESTPKGFDLNWMKYLDSIHVDVVDVEGTDAYVEITLDGQWTPYKINIGNIDLSLLSEQKLFGLLFGFNTYPKNRRYNPVQSTIAYDADLLPREVKPYVLLTGKDDDKWVNNQYKGIEKIYLTYESLERDVLEIYVLSYERIIPVWMGKVKLPKEIREKVRIRKGLYNY